MTEVSIDGDGGPTQLTMDQRQFAQLMATVAAALRQTTAPLLPDQQSVDLKFRLLRNGLGRFSSASEKFDRALIRMEQIQYEDCSELVILDPIPPDARSMVLFVDSQRVVRDLPGRFEDGRGVHRVDGDSVTKVIELVEFLDQFGVAIAAGVPVQVDGSSRYEGPESGVAESAPGSASQAPRESPAKRRSQRSQPRQGS